MHPATTRNWAVAQQSCSALHNAEIMLHIHGKVTKILILSNVNSSTIQSNYALQYFNVACDRKGKWPINSLVPPISKISVFLGRDLALSNSRIIKQKS